MLMTMSNNIFPSKFIEAIFFSRIIQIANFSIFFDKLLKLYYGLKAKTPKEIFIIRAIT